MLTYEPTLSDLLIAFLESAHNTKTYHRILRERAFASANPNSIYTALSRLKKQGYIQKEAGHWMITKKKYTKYTRYIFINSPFPKESSNNTLVCFDILESKKRERNWLRKQLQIFGYRMIQKSVWVGPGPLPKSFERIAKELKIKGFIRTFKIILPKI